jgi:hypothetical protein
MLFKTVQNKNGKRKSDLEVLTNKKIQKLELQLSIDRMSSEAFSEYLKQFISIDEISLLDMNLDDMDLFYDNLSAIGKHLKEIHNLAERFILKIYFIFGQKLVIARAKFDERKIAEGVTQTWSEWVTNYVGLSKSQCGKIRVVTEMLNDFPKLQNLKGISHTKLYNMRKKIKDAFKCEDIAKEWQ